MHKDERWLVRELPIKRRSTEISAPYSGSAGAVGRHKNILIRDAFGAGAASTRVGMFACCLRGAVLKEGENRTEDVVAWRRIANEQNTI